MYYDAAEFYKLLRYKYAPIKKGETVPDFDDSWCKSE